MTVLEILFLLQDHTHDKGLCIGKEMDSAATTAFTYSLLERMDTSQTDAAYPLRSWLLTPYKRREANRFQNARRYFNYVHSSMRMKVVHAFGRLMAMWRCLRSPSLSPDTASDMVVAAVVLHNLSIEDTQDDVSDDVLNIEEAIRRIAPEAEPLDDRWREEERNGEVQAWRDELAHELLRQKRARGAIDLVPNRWDDPTSRATIFYDSEGRLNAWV